MVVLTFKLLDCTLRDGGYINSWNFAQCQISSTIENLTNAGIEYVELGYLTSVLNAVGGSRFYSVESASQFIPKDRRASKYLIMADVSQFDADSLCERKDSTLDGIRVVFYKRQVEEAFAFCEKVTKKGYDLFLQPMVTIDYTFCEFQKLIERFYARYPLYAVSIVDSFGCMDFENIEQFIRVLEQTLDEGIKIGFHAHNNMQLSLTNAISLTNYKSKYDFVIDASVGGMGRGAGNLSTELIANYTNKVHNKRYELNFIMKIMSEVVEPLSKKEKWGYSSFFFLTAMRQAHPNFASYLLGSHEISVLDFYEYMKLVPDDMLTKCTRPYVEEMYEKFVGSK